MRTDLPTGTVTFLFTDVEGSTKLLHELGADAYADALAVHRRTIRAAIAEHAGVEVDTQGDAFFIAFPTAPGALAAAAAARDALDGPIRVRMGLHSGTPLVTDEGYVGADVHRAARIASGGHGGQILLSASTAALVERERLRDLGPHRLKDLSAPERIFQLGDGEFPPLKTLRQTNLPIAVTPFLGRERELREVVQLLEDARLLTLTGPGGTGKTRLAMQAAAMLAEDYPDGVWSVPLAPLRDPELVLSAASDALGAKAGLAEHIGDKAMLLLFDNFEQVIDAGADVAALLTSCPQVQLLVTSREPLHVTGEQEYPVPTLAHEEGVSFFLARARSIVPDFEASASVSEICSRLDDLPLALELAAARVKALSPAQILERLDRRLPLLTGGARDAPERQRTLRATIEWSYELLTDDEQRLFNRLGVFAGGGRLDAAEAVADADLDTLQSLVDRSLLRHTGERYWMLETIREYSAQFVDDDLRSRHAQYFVDLAEESFAQLRGDPGDWLERLDPERANFRAAFEWLMGEDETQLALQLVGALGRFWYQRGDSGEGRLAIERALAADTSRTAARARALHGAATLSTLSREETTASSLAAEALEIYRELGDEWNVSYSLFLLGHIAGYQEEWEFARERLTDSVAHFEALGDDHFRILAKFNLAWVYERLGDNERNRALVREVEDEARRTGNKRVLAAALSVLGTLAGEDGHTHEALQILRESYGLVQEVGERPEVPDMLARMASVLAAAGQPVRATRMLAKATELYKETGGGERPWIVERDARTLESVKAALDEETFQRAWNEGVVLSEDEALEHSRLAE